MEEEGFVDPTPRMVQGRGANYTTKEDKLLCGAWKKIGLDLVVGVEQQSSSYWECIYEYFKAHNKSGIHRSQVSLSHRWQSISAECQKWSACLAQVEHLNPSSTNAEDKVILCLH